MSKVVTSYDGIKYSLQPHGLKSKILYALAAFVVAFGGALAVVSPAQGAAPIFTQIDSCLPGWYWKSGTGENEVPPSVTSSGMVFNDQDTVNAVLAWHQAGNTPLASLNVSGGKWDMAILSGTPGADSWFKVITSSPFTTLSYDGNGRWFSGNGSGSGTSYWTGTKNIAEITSISALNNAVISLFGLGTGTSSVDGQWTASQLSFAGSTYPLSCVPPAPSPSPVAVPAPAVTVIKTVTEPAATTEAPSPSPSASPSPTASKRATASVAASPKPSMGTLTSSGSNSLAPWGVAVAGTTGLILAAVGVAGIVSRRRRYQGSHHSDQDYGDEDTEAMPTYGGGGYSGGSYGDGSDATMVMPSVPGDTPPESPGTEPLPPAK